MGIFDRIDFNNLPQDLNEDGVREEIVAPFLKVLGYSAFEGENRIIRNPHLKHPFVQWGVKKDRNCLIPDYLIQVKGKNAFILDAKSPKENIFEGKNVCQAYSYAIHREIQAKRFVLCNGREMSIFDVNGEKPILYFKLADASEKEWKRVYELLSPAAFTNPHIFNYKPDYGIWCVRNGINSETPQYFYSCYVEEVARLDDDTFTFMAVIRKNEEFLASFDFNISLFEEFMKQVPEGLKETVNNHIRKSPFRYIANDESESFSLRFVAFLSEYVIRNENEDYLPLSVKEFF